MCIPPYPEVASLRFYITAHHQEILFPKLSATLLPAKVTTHVINAFQRSFLSTSIQVLMSTKASIGTRRSTLLLSSPVLKL